MPIFRCMKSLRFSLCWLDREGPGQRGQARTLKSGGERVNPITLSMLGISPGEAGAIVKRWSREVKKMKSSILAKFSPRHTLFPGGK